MSDIPFELDPMRHSFTEASVRLGIPVEEVIDLIIEGRLKVYETPSSIGERQYVWLSQEPSSAPISTLDFERSGGASGERDSPRVTMLMEALRLAAGRIHDLSQQLDAKDRQIEMDARQLEHRAHEVARLHELLRTSQEAALSARLRRRRWWRLPGSRGDGMAATNAT
ncbi:MAG: hypothetical protein L0177_03760 [Chloroflexi bacterium]|nr:hypothetical protein [Chloroflexota bacterium]